eukprot:24791_1
MDAKIQHETSPDSRKGINGFSFPNKDKDAEVMKSIDKNMIFTPTNKSYVIGTDNIINDYHNNENIIYSKSTKDIKKEKQKKKKRLYKWHYKI